MRWLDAQAGDVGPSHRAIASRTPVGRSAALGITALHADRRQSGHEHSAAAVDVAWQGRPPSLEPSEGEYGAGVRTVYGCFVRPALTIICVQSPSSADPVKVMPVLVTGLRDPTP